MKSYDVEVRIAGVDESSGDVCGESATSSPSSQLPDTRQHDGMGQERASEHKSAMQRGWS